MSGSGKMNWDRLDMDERRSPRRKEAGGTFKEPRAWEKRRRALRTSPTGVQLRRPR